MCIVAALSSQWIACSAARNGRCAWPLTEALDCTPTTVAETKCPKCSGELRFMPPERAPEAVSWIGGELAGWVVFASTAGAVGCVLTDRHAIAAVLSTVAAIGVFLLFER